MDREKLKQAIRDSYLAEVEAALEQMTEAERIVFMKWFVEGAAAKPHAPMFDGGS